jgi:hypothetical protein
MFLTYDNKGGQKNKMCMLVNLITSSNIRNPMLHPAGSASAAGMKKEAGS